MAAEQPQYRQSTSLPHAKSQQTTDGVMGTGRFKPTCGGEQRRNESLVSTDEENKEVAGGHGRSGGGDSGTKRTSLAIEKINHGEEFFPDLLALHLAASWVSDDHPLPRPPKASPMQAKELPHPALDSIPDHRLPYFSTDGHSQPGTLLHRRRVIENNKVGGAEPFRPSSQKAKFAGPSDPALGRKAMFHSDQPSPDSQPSSFQDSKLFSCALHQRRIGWGPESEILSPVGFPAGEGSQVSSILLGANRRGEALPPLGPAAVDHQPAVLRSHPHQKPVRPFAGHVGGLEGSFHRLLRLGKPASLKSERRGIEVCQGKALYRR